jgi:hypothetical protein
MVFVTLITLLSFLFALIELDWKWSSEGHNYLHAVLGLIVVICSVINVKKIQNSFKLILLNNDVKICLIFSLFWDSLDLLQLVAFVAYTFGCIGLLDLLPFA